MYYLIKRSLDFSGDFGFSLKSHLPTPHQFPMDFGISQVCRNNGVPSEISFKGSNSLTFKKAGLVRYEDPIRDDFKLLYSPADTKAVKHALGVFLEKASKSIGEHLGIESPEVYINNDYIDIDYMTWDEYQELQDFTKTTPRGLFDITLDFETATFDGEEYRLESTYRSVTPALTPCM